MSARELVTGGIVLGAMGIAFATVSVQNHRTASLEVPGGPAATTAGSSLDDLGPGLTPDLSNPPGSPSAQSPVPHTGCGSY